MNETLPWVELARLPIAKMQDVLLARFVARNEAAKLGFTPAVVTRLSTAISEITRNVVQHAGCAGEIQIGLVSEGGRSGLRLVVSDKGKGFAHAERFLEKSQQGGTGAGLPGTRKLVDALEIQSAPGAGTTVTMDIWKPEGSA